MKYKYFLILPIALLLHGCEDKPKFKILTPVEQCVEQEKLPLALCECIHDPSNSRESAVAPDPDMPNTSESPEQTYWEPGDEVANDGTIIDTRSSSEENETSGTGWAGSKDKMLSALDKYKSSINERREDCLKKMEIK